MEPVILFVEDDAAIRDMVSQALRRDGYRVREAQDTATADRLIGDRLPDLILLDWMLPGISGIEYARRLKRDDITRDTPIIMLTARGEEEDRLKGFDAGVEDYVCKPFSTRELLARVKAVIRRAGPFGSDEVLEVNGLSLNPATHRVVANGEPLKLGPTEFRLLRFFLSNPERVFSRRQLLDRVWGTNVYVEERTVDVHIRRLRKALGVQGLDRMIQTVHATGYRFSPRAG